MALKGTLAIDTTQYQRALADATRAMQQFGLDTSKAGDNIRKLSTSLDGSKIVAQAHQATAAIQGMGGATALTDKEARKHLATIDEARAKYRALGQDVPDSLNKMARELDRTSGTIKGMGTAAATALGSFAGFLGAQAVSAGIRAIGDGFRFVASTAIDMNASLERTTLQFETLMGDADRAREHVKGLFEFAKATPFETGPIIEASRLLQTFGGDALNTKRTLTLLGDAAAATGAPIDQLGMWVGRLYANLQAGKPIGEAAQRLTELAVIGPQARMALEDVAKSGLSIEEKFAVAEQALGRFSGAMEKQAGTWDGVISTFKDTASIAIAEGLQPLFEAARDAIKELNSLAQSKAFEDWGQTAKSVASDVAAKIREIPDALLTMKAGLAQAKVDWLEFQEWLGKKQLAAAETAATMYGALGNVPGIGQFAAQGAAALAQGQAGNTRRALEEVRQDLAKARDEVARSLVTLAARAAGAGEGLAKTASAATGSGGGQGAAKALTDLETPAKASAKALQALAQYAAQLANNTDWLRQFPGGQWQLPTGGWNGGGGGLYTTQLTPNPFGGTWSPYGLGNAMGYTPGRTPVNGFVGPALPPWSPDYRAIGAGLPGVVTGAIQGGGNVAGSIGSYLGGSMLSGVGERVSASLTKSLGGGMLGNMLGGVLGSAIPLVGSLLGGLVGKLFGPSRGAILGQEADARIGQTQAQLLQQYGSVDAIRALGPAGSALADAWGSKNVQGEQWFNQLNAALQEQLSLQEQIKSVEEQRKALVESLVPTYSQVLEAAARYGISVEGLGQQVAQLGTTDTFKTMLEDIQLLVRAGGDMGGILSGMADEISEVVRRSVKLGTEIPANMRPYIEELARAGLLLDENGHAITDLASLKWGEPVKTQADLVNDAIAKLTETFDKLNAQLEALFDRLANGLPDAAQRGAAGANAALSGIESPDIRYGGSTPVEGYASGSGGLRDFGSGTLAVLHGREAVLTERQLRQRTGPIVVQVQVDGRTIAEATARHLPDVLPAYGM